MQFGQPAHQRQAKARAARLAIIAIVHLVEGHEDAGQLVARNAGAIVAHHDLEAAALGRAGQHVNAAALRGELHRVGDQVDQHLFQGALIGIKRRSVLFDMDHKLLALFGGLEADQLEGDFEGAAGIQRIGRDFHAARFDLGDVQQIVDQGQKMRARGMDVAGIILVAGIAHRAETFLADDFRKAQNGVQRRAQLMAHIGQEGGLGGIGGFRLEALAQRIVTGFFQFARHVFHLEAQPRIFIHAGHQRAAREPHLGGEQRRGGGKDDIQDRAAHRKARGAHQRDRQQAGQEQQQVAAPRHHQAGDHCDNTGAQKYVIDRIARLPQQPGHETPGQRDARFHHHQMRKPVADLLIAGQAVGAAQIERGHAARHAQGQGHDGGENQGQNQFLMPEHAHQIAAQHRDQQRPERRGETRCQHRLRGEVELRLEHADITAAHHPHHLQKLIQDTPIRSVDPVGSQPKF